MREEGIGDQGKGKRIWYNKMRMKRAFTLIELLVVVVVIVTLMAIVFRLGSIGGDAEARNKTVARMQRVENCISGYYAAFGSYPPVKLHGSRNIYYKVNQYGIQQVENDNPETGELKWDRVEAACRSQPVAMNFPFPSYMQGYVRQVSEALTELHNEGGEDSAYAKNSALANLFDALDNPSSTIGGKSKYSSWAKCQLFRFGLMSYLLPRFVVMMGHSDNTLYDEFSQWSNNNQMPCRFEDGSPYESWGELNQELSRTADKWKVEVMPTQAVTARWMPNLEGILHCERDLKVYGVSLNDWDGGRNVSIENPWPVLYSGADSQGGENSGGGSQQYALDGVTCKDGWYNDFYYYSEPPYQNYRLWSAGPNGKTFPPWISSEEIANDSTLSANRKTIENWVADDIMHMSH